MAWKYKTHTGTI